MMSQPAMLPHWSWSVGWLIALELEKTEREKYRGVNDPWFPLCPTHSQLARDSSVGWSVLLQGINLVDYLNSQNTNQSKKVNILQKLAVAWMSFIHYLNTPSLYCRPTYYYLHALCPGQSSSNQLAPWSRALWCGNAMWCGNALLYGQTL